MEGFVVGHQVLGEEDKEEKRDGKADALFGDAVFEEEAGEPNRDDQGEERDDREDVVVELGGREGKEKVGEEKAAEEEVVAQAKSVGEVAPRPLHKAEQGDRDHGGPREESKADLTDIQVEAIVGFFDNAGYTGEMVIDKPFSHEGKAVMEVHVVSPCSSDNKEQQDAREEKGFEVFGLCGLKR